MPQAKTLLNTHCKARSTLSTLKSAQERYREVVSEPGSSGQTWPEVWRGSAECSQIRKEVEALVAERKPQPPVEEDGRQYAASTWTQTKLLTVRVGRHFYRDASYVSATLVIAI